MTDRTDTGSGLVRLSVIPEVPYQRDIYNYYGYARSGGRTYPGARPGGL
jgi:hypothetical protein